MTNQDYINAYKSEERIISDYYKFSNNGTKTDLTGIITPLKIDNRQIMSPTDNQTTTPHCGAYSAATLVESLLWKRTGKLKQLDSHQIYALAKQLDGHINTEGTYLEAALEAVITLCKKDEDFSFIKNAKIGKFFKSGDNSLTINTVKRLIHQYDFLQIGFQIDEGWLRCNNSNYILKSSGKSLGGHAVNICGYDDSGFYILNQWGKTWGSKGFAVMPYDLFVKTFMYCTYLYNIVR